jgi:hypothetical protein
MKTQLDAIGMINRQRDLIEDLEGLSPYSEAFRRWHRDTEAVITEVGGDRKEILQAFQNILYTPLFLSCRCGDTVFDEAYASGLKEARRLLNLLADGLNRE